MAFQGTASHAALHLLHHPQSEPFGIQAVGRCQVTTFCGSGIAEPWPARCCGQGDAACGWSHIHMCPDCVYIPGSWTPCDSVPQGLVRTSHLALGHTQLAI
jgi:hypothetical protein